MDEDPSPSGHHDHRPACPITNTSAAPFNASAFANDGKHHILLAASGSVATIKLGHIAKALVAYPEVSIRIVLTRSAERFLQGQSNEIPHLREIEQIEKVEAIYF